MTAPVERQEMRLLARQPSGHVNLVRVRSEMYQRPLLEFEQRRARVAVFLELPHGMTPVLARAGILQFDRCHREPVYRQRHVQRAIVGGMTRRLARHRQPVLAEQLQHLVVRAVRGLEVGEGGRSEGVSP